MGPRPAASEEYQAGSGYQWCAFRAPRAAFVARCSTQIVCQGHDFEFKRLLRDVQLPFVAFLVYCGEQQSLSALFRHPACTTALCKGKVSLMTTCLQPALIMTCVAACAWLS